MSQFTYDYVEGYRQVPRLSRVPVLAKPTLKSLAILTGNLTDIEGRASTCSPLIQTSSNTESEIVKVSTITDFFYDDPTMPYTPLPEHDLDQSPCYPIIAQKHGYFYCRLHPEIKNAYLESIEHHIAKKALRSCGA